MFMQTNLTAFQTQRLNETRQVILLNTYNISCTIYFPENLKFPDSSGNDSLEMEPNKMSDPRLRWQWICMITYDSIVPGECVHVAVHTCRYEAHTRHVCSISCGSMRTSNMATSIWTCGPSRKSWWVSLRRCCLLWHLPPHLTDT